MSKFRVSLLLVFATLTGCAAGNLNKMASYDPATEARIRVYFGADSHFYFNSECVRGASLFEDSASGMAVAKPRFFSLFNKTVGMPLPNDAYKYYDEYIIRADQPITIAFRRGGTATMDLGGGVRITTIEAIEFRARSFVPEAGGDYEAFPYSDRWGLEAKIRKLRIENQKILVDDVHSTVVDKCK